MFIFLFSAGQSSLVITLWWEGWRGGGEREREKEGEEEGGGGGGKETETDPSGHFAKHLATQHVNHKLTFSASLEARGDTGALLRIGIGSWFGAGRSN